MTTSLIPAIYDLLSSAITTSTAIAEDNFSKFAVSKLDEEKRLELPAASLATLPTLTCFAAGGAAQEAIPAAAAWRGLHLAAKLLDDIQDGDAIIIGKGEITPDVASNLATGLIAASMAIVTNGMGNKNLDAQTRLDLSAEFSKVILQMCAGQHIDITQTGQLDFESYRNIMAAKSGVFIQLATWSGARCTTADEKQLEQFKIFGHNLGMMLQLNDDIRDFHQTGAKGDIASGKNTYPVIYALSVADKRDKARLHRWLAAAATDSQAEENARALVRALGAEVYVLAEIMRYRLRSQEALDNLGLEQKRRQALDDWLQRLSTHRINGK